jgi:hypothetical protein
MRAKKMRRIILFVTIITLILVYGIAMADTKKAIDGIRLSVERSALPQEAKASLLKKASDAVNAGIQSDDIAVIINRGLNRGVDSKTIEGFIDTAIKVKGQNLPARPVMDRIQQGLSKGVPPERILGVTKRLAEKLTEADTITKNLVDSGVKAGDSKEREDAVQAVARALERSIPEDIIAQIGVTVKKHNYSLSMFSRAIHTMTTFVESGMPANQASRLVNKAMNKGYSEKDMLTMEKEAANEIKEGKRMEDIGRRMESVMERGSFGQGFRGMEGGRGPGTGSGMGGGSGMGSGSGWGSGSGMERR